MVPREAGLSAPPHLPTLPAPSQPSRPHLAAALPCFRCIQTSSGSGWRLRIWGFKHTKGLQDRQAQAVVARAGARGPDHARLSRAKQRPPSLVVPWSAALRGGASASQEATQPHAQSQ